ncbi:uncharacterized protein CLUP02_08671 [Colletotrichum lupini]|uniref:Uncharacterized protein n=1 Tax=Colletotrichum lupini TaxID=145971 RepID=A0A9Q8SV55_9PEZI|nr:uncharacterized protein CLUP02_08671 [Colletotrichum lupini]UQC83177.1 hypothetical protein CLUP02_08671 [Colletotrichum lupini]
MAGMVAYRKCGASNESRIRTGHRYQQRHTAETATSKSDGQPSRPVGLYAKKKHIPHAKMTQVKPPLLPLNSIPFYLSRYDRPSSERANCHLMNSMSPSQHDRPFSVAVPGVSGVLCGGVAVVLHPSFLPQFQYLPSPSRAVHVSQRSRGRLLIGKNVTIFYVRALRVANPHYNSYCASTGLGDFIYDTRGRDINWVTIAITEQRYSTKATNAIN